MATDPRPARSQSAYSNTPAKLPTLPTIRVTDPQMQRFIEALRVWIDARSGARDIYEKAVTMRDLVQLGLIDGSVLSRGWGLGAAPGPNAVVVETPSTNLVMSNEAFANSIINTRLFQELMRRLDDPARFDALPEEIRSRLLVDIAAEAAQRGADIRRVEEKLQTQEKSLAVAIDEVTAAVDNSVAGVRQSVFAYADENRAVAGTVTQVKARIDGVPIPVDQIDGTVYASLAALQTAKPVGTRGIYYQVDDPASTDNILYMWDGAAYYIAGRGTTASASATVEQQMTAIADRAQGLEAQYTLKVQAGNKVAGFGIAATQSDQNGATSAFIVAADKFAIVAASDSIPNPLSPPTQRIPFGVDTVNDVIYINGKVRINSGGTALEDIVSQAYALRIDLSNDQFLVATDAAGNGGVFGSQAESALTIYRGTSTETSSWTLSIAATNCTAQLWNGSTWVAGPISGVVSPKVRVTDMSADNCVVTITATRTSNPTLTIDFTGSKVKAGADGTPATLRYIEPSVGAVKRTEAGAAVPSSVTFSAYAQSGTGAPGAYSGRIRASYSVAATPTLFTTITPDPTVDAATRSVTVPSDAVYVRGELFASGGFTTLYDSETIPVIADGPTGPTGLRGSLSGYGANYGIYSATWSDGYANRVINNMLTGETATTTLATTTHLRIGDEVTLTDAAGAGATKAFTKYWGGSGWLDPGVKIDGNLLVTGTVSADKINTTGLEIRDASGNVILSSGNTPTFAAPVFSPIIKGDFYDDGTAYTLASGKYTIQGGYVVEGATPTAGADWVTLTSSTTDPLLRTPTTLNIDGSRYTKAQARIRRVAGTSWDGVVFFETHHTVFMSKPSTVSLASGSAVTLGAATFYLAAALNAGDRHLALTTDPTSVSIGAAVSYTGVAGGVTVVSRVAAHSESGSYLKQRADGTVGGNWVTLEWDMSSLTYGGTNWLESAIKTVRFDFGAASSTFDVDWVAVGRYTSAGPEKITAQNVSTFISSAAIGWAQIGDLTIATSGGIRSGKTAYGSGTGWLLEYNEGTPRFDIGSDTAYMRWTGSALEIKNGTVVGQLTQPTMSVELTPSSGTIMVYTSDDIVYGNLTSTVTGGQSPYTYSWILESFTKVGATRISNIYGSYIEVSGSQTLNTVKDVAITCVVTDANGRTASYTSEISFQYGTPP